MNRPIIGVMGPGNTPTKQDRADARQLGRLIAENDWILLTGGRHTGVMHAASRGADEAGGLVIGILPGADRGGASPHVHIPIVTGMGSARNNINVLSSDIVVACGSGPGTASEIALALKAGKPVILLNQPEEAEVLFRRFSPKLLYRCTSPREAVDHIRTLLPA